MKKYKLIKEYPSSPKLGTEITIENHTISRYFDGKRWLYEFDKSPEFWQEVIEIPEYVKCIRDNQIDYGTNGIDRVFKVIGENSKNGSDYILEYNGKGLPSAFKERFIPATKEEYDNQFKDYKILSLARFCSIKPTITDVSDYNDGFIEALLKCDNARIHSIKRKLDGEIFTIGDKVVGYNNSIAKIKTIDLVGEISLNIGTDKHEGFSLKNLKKVKQPLFTTEDGVDIFENEHYCFVRTKDFSLFEQNYAQQSHVEDDKQYPGFFVNFSTKEKAEEYILLNKPCLSYNDVMKTLYGNSHSDCLSLLAVIKSRLGIQP